MSGKRVLIAVLLCVVFAPAVWAKTLYVSTSGNDDTGTGDQSAPYQTIGKAFEKAKDLKTEHADVTIEVAKGTYTLTNQILVNKDYPNITLNLEAETKITANTEIAVATGHAATVTNSANGSRNVGKRFFLVDDSGSLIVNGQGKAVVDLGTNNTGCFMVMNNGTLTINNIKLNYNGDKATTSLANENAMIYAIGAKAYLNDVIIVTDSGGGLLVETLKINNNTIQSYVEVNNCDITCNGTHDTHINTAMAVGGHNSHIVIRGGTYKAYQSVVMARNTAGIIDIYDGNFIKTGDDNTTDYSILETNTPGANLLSNINIYGGKVSGGSIVSKNQGEGKGDNDLSVYGGWFTTKSTTYLHDNKTSKDILFYKGIEYPDTTDDTYKYKVLYFTPSLDNKFGIKGEEYTGNLTITPQKPSDRTITVSNVQAALVNGTEEVTVGTDGKNLKFTPLEAKDYIFTISADLTDNDTTSKDTAVNTIIIPVGSVANVEVDKTAANSGTEYEGNLSADVATPTDWVKAAKFTLGTVSPTWDGLTIDESGKLTGTAPVVMKSTVFTVPVTAEAEVLTTIGERTKFTKTENLTITVEPLNFTVTPSVTELAAGTANQSYEAAVTFTVAPSGLNYTISAEGLPSGLAFSNGKITGTPTESGTFNVKFNVTVTDVSGETVTQTVTLSLVISAASSDGGVIIDDNGGMTVSGDTATTDFNDFIEQLSADNKLGSITSVTINDNNSLTTIQGLDKLTSLKSLDVIGNNTVTNVDLSNSESLTNVNLQNCTSLTEVNAENCTNLETLDCSGGSVEKISLQGCENLKDLSCQNNNLESLDVSGCPNLTSLDCSANNIGDLNVDGCENLESLNCGANSLSSLNVTLCRRLQVLYCYSNNLTELNVQYSERLYILVCDDNSLNTLNVEQNKLLRRLDCQNNAMPALDITSSVFAQLQRLKCYGQSLSGLNVTSSGGIYSFNLRNYIQSSIQSKTFSAASLNANNDDLNNFNSSSSIDNVDASSIKAYDADGNEIEVTGYTSGVISFASKPAKIVYDYDTGYNNTMMDVTISEQTKRNGGSTVETKTSGGGGGGGGCDAGFGIFSLLIILTGFFGIKASKKKFLALFILSLIPMFSSVASADVAINSTNFPDEIFRAYVSTSADTNGDKTLSDAEISAVTIIDVNTSEISNLKGIENFAELIELYCYANDLTALDVSSNKKLQVLECDNNQLTSLNLSQNSELRELECELNCIRTLDLSSNTLLYYVKCYSQTISNVKVTSSDEIFYVDLGNYAGTSNLGKILSGDKDITGENSSGDVIYYTSYDDTSGVVGFSEYPYSVTYKYETGYYESANKEMTMDVTLVTVGDVDSQKIVKTSGGGGSSSGCNAMDGTKSFILFAALVLVINFYLRKNFVK